MLTIGALRQALHAPSREIWRRSIPSAIAKPPKLIKFAVIPSWRIHINVISAARGNTTATTSEARSSPKNSNNNTSTKTTASNSALLTEAIAATRPEALDVSFVEPSALEREKAVLTEQAMASGKPPAVIEKMVEGRIRKYYEEVVLLEQVWVHDGETRVKEVVKKAGMTLSGFARFQLGEGIDKQTSDFAAEVAAAAGQG